MPNINPVVPSPQSGKPGVTSGTIVEDIEDAILHSSWLKMQALKIATVGAGIAGTWFASKTGTDQAQDIAAISLLTVGVVTYILGTLQSYSATHRS